MLDDKVNQEVHYMAQPEINISMMDQRHFLFVAWLAQVSKHVGVVSFIFNLNLGSNITRRMPDL